MNHGFYAFRHGDVGLVRKRNAAFSQAHDAARGGPEDIVPVQKALSILYDADAGAIYRHGSLDRVVAFEAKQSPGLFNLVRLDVPTNEITQDMLDAINACLMAPERELTLADKLAALAPAGRPAMFFP